MSEAEKKTVDPLVKAAAIMFAIAAAGLVLIVAGVALLAGTGWALIASGVALLVVAAVVRRGVFRLG